MGSYEKDIQLFQTAFSRGTSPSSRISESSFSHFILQGYTKTSKKRPRLVLSRPYRNDLCVRALREERGRSHSEGIWPTRGTVKKRIRHLGHDHRAFCRAYGFQ